MTQISWKQGVSGNWSTASDWSSDTVPGATDAVTIAAAGGYTISVTTAERAASLDITAGAATLAIEAALGVGSFTMSTGALSLSAGDTLTAGSAALGQVGDQAPYINGPGTFATSGATVLAAQTGSYDDINIAGGATWANRGTAKIGGSIDIGNGYDQGATLTNLAGGIFDFTTNAAIVQLNPNDVAIFNNDGVLEKTGGTGISSIGAAIDDTGTIVAATGTLAFALGGDFGGTIRGAGVVDFTGGTSLITATVTPTIAINGATVDLDSLRLTAISETAGTLGVTGNSALSGALTATAGSMAFAAAETLTVAGTTRFGEAGADGPYIEGPGTLVTTGVVVLAAQSGGEDDIDIAGGVIWANSGTAKIGGQIDIGNGYDQGGTLTNTAGGIFDFTGNAAIVQLNGNDSAIFNNAGLIEKTGGTGTSSIGATVNSSGTISVASGTFDFALGGTLGGTIEGAGLVDFTGGTALVTATVTPAITITGGTVDFDTLHLRTISQKGGTLGVTGNSALSGAFTATAGSMAFAAGKTFAVDGTTSLGIAGADGPYIGGSGTLVTRGAVTLATQTAGDDDINIAGGVTWENGGTAKIGGQIDIGNGYDQGATITNLTSGVFDITGNSGISQLNPNDAAVFNNAGLIEKTGGTGISSIGAAVNNTGIISVGTGTLALALGGTLGGTIKGVGLVDFTGGTAVITGSVSTATTLTGGTVDLDSLHIRTISEAAGTLGVTGLSAISGALTVTGGSIQFDTGETLTVAGTTSFGTTGANGPYIDGPGTLVTNGAVVLAKQSGSDYDINIAGDVTWANSGTVSIGGQIDIGNGYDQGATIINQAGGLIKLTSTAAAIDQLNPNDLSVFDNAGTLATSAGSGTLNIGAALNNTGTIDITSGMLNLQNGGALGGSITGTGSLMFNGPTAFDPAKNSIDFIDVKCTNDRSVSIGYGAVTFETSFTNNGTLSTTGGVINCSEELKGTGVIKLGGLGVVNLLAGSASTQTVDFQPSFGALELAVPLIYQGMIAGFAPGDTIDLVATPETSFSYASNVLTVYDGAIPVAKLHFSGEYLQSHFSLTPDAAGGTIIGYSSS